MAIEIAALETSITVKSSTSEQLAREESAVSGSVNRMNTTASTLADPFTQAFNRVASDAAANMSATANTVASSAAQMASSGAGIANPFTQSFGQMSASVNAALGSATAALQQMGTQGGASAQTLASAQAQVSAALANVNAALREESAALADMNAKVQSGQATFASMGASIERTQAIVAGLTAEQRALQVASQQLSAGLNEQAAAALRDSAALYQLQTSTQQAATQSQAALAQASAAIQQHSGIAQQGKASLEQLANAQIGLSQSGQQLQTAIRAENALLQELQTRAAGASGALRDQLGNAANESRQRLIQLTVAQQQVSTQTQAVSQRMSRWGEVTSGLSRIMSMHTSQISTQHTVLSGYDALVQGFLRTMGGFPIIVASAISIGLQLLNLFIKQKEETKEVVNVTKELIDFDLQMAAAFQRAAGSAGNLSGSMTSLSQSMTRLAEIDVVKTIEKLIESSERYHAAGQRMINTDNQSSIAKVNLAKASEGLKAAQDALDNTLVVNQQHLALLIGELLHAKATHESAQNAVVGLRTASEAAIKTREQERAGIEQAAGVLLRYMEVTGKTAAEIMQMGRDAGFTAERMHYLAAAVDTATSAQFQYAAALRAVKLAQADASATGAGVVKIIEGANRQLEEATTASWLNRNAVLSQTDAQIFYKAQAKQVIDVLKERITYEHRSELQNKNSARANELLNERIAQLPPKLRDSVRAYQESERASGSFSSTATKSAGAVKSAWQQMGTDTTAIIRNWVSSMGYNFENLKQLVNAMEPAQRASLQSQAQAWFEGRKKIEIQQLLNLASTKRWGEMSLEVYSGMPANIKAHLDKMGVTHATTFKAIDKDFKEYESALKLNTARINLAYEKLVDDIVSSFVRMQQTRVPTLDILDASNLEQAARAANAAITSVREALAVGLSPAAGVRSVESATESIIKVWTEWGERMGASTEEISARIQESLDELFSGENIPSTAANAAALTFQRWLDETARGQVEILNQWGQFQPQLESQIDFVAQTLSGRFDRMGAEVVQQNYTAAIEMVRAWATAQPALQPVLAALEQRFAVMNSRIASNTLTQTDKITATVLQKYGQMRTGLSNEMNQIIGVFAAGWGKVTDAAIAKVADHVSKVVRLINTMPGQLGNALRGGLSQIQQWVSFIDAALSILHDIWHQVPASVGEAAAVVIAAVTNQNAVVTQQTQDMAAAAKAATADMSQSVQDDVAQMTEAVIADVREMHDVVVDTFDDMAAKAKEASASAAEDVTADTEGSLQQISDYAKKAVAILAGVGTFMATRHQGKLRGVLGGAAAGAQIGGAIGGGLGAGIGAGIGAIAGLFGTGKSAAQKKAEEDAAKRAAIDMQQAAQSVVNSAIDGLNKALEFFKGVEDFAEVPRRLLRQFMRQYESVVRELFDFFGTLKPEQVEHAQEFAESIGAMMDSLAIALNMFQMLETYVRVPDVQTDAFLTDYKAIITKFIAGMNEVEGATRAARVASKSMAIIEAIQAAAQAFELLQGYKQIPVENMDAFMAAFRDAINRVIAMAAEADTGGVRAAQRYAERARAMVDLLAAGAQAFIVMQDLKAVQTENIDALVAAVKLTVERVMQAAELMDAAGMRNAIRFSEAAQASLQLIQAGVGALNEVGKFSDVSPLALDRLAEGIKLAVIRMATVAALIEIDAARHAGEFSEASRAVFDLMKSAIDALVALQNYQGVAPATIERMGTDVRLTVEEIAGIATSMATDGVTAAGEFATASSSVFDLISSATGAMTSLQDYKGAVPEVIAQLGDDMVEAVLMMQTVAARLDGEAIGSAAVIAEQALAIFEAIRTGIEAMRSLHDYQNVPQTAFRDFANDIEEVIKLLAHIVSRAHTIKDFALEFRDAAIEAANAMGAGVAALARVQTLAREVLAATTAKDVTMTIAGIEPAAGISLPADAVIPGAEGSTVSGNGQPQTVTNNFYIDGVTIPARDIQELSDVVAVFQGEQHDARARNVGKSRK